MASTVASAAPRRGARVRVHVEHEPEAGAADVTAEDEPLEAIEEALPIREPSLDSADVEQPVRKRPHRARGTELYFRAGVAHILPRISSSAMTLEAEGILALVPMAPVQGGVETDPTTIFAAIIGVAPAVFHGYVAFETIVAVPKKAKLRAKGDLANKSLAPDALGIPTGIPPLGEELGEASAVPPMVTAIVRSPALGPVRVYAGGGASVLFVRDARVTNRVLTEVATPKIEISPAFGVVAQAGIDVQIHGRFYARLDVKEAWFSKSESRISNIHVRTTIPMLETVNVGTARSETQANPIIVQFGLGASF